MLVFFDLIRTRCHHSGPVWNILVENELNFCHKSCVKEQFIWICESGVRNGP